MKTFKIISLFSISLFFLTIISCKKDQEVITNIIPATDITEKLQELVNQEYDSYLEKYPEFPGGLAVHVISPKGSGYAQKGVDDSFTDRYHFRAQSLTKSITAAGIMLLHQNGLLNITDYITDTVPGKDFTYLPSTSDYNIPYKDQICIRDLLSHRAGVFDIINDPAEGGYYIETILDSMPDYTFTIDEIVGVNAENQLSYFSPGTDFHYSNIGYMMLAKIIERISGKSYKSFMHDEFVVPLGMTDTSFPDSGSDQTIPSPFVSSMGWAGDYILDLTESNMSLDIGEGNMISSTRDIANFYSKLIKGEAGVNNTNINMKMLDCYSVSNNNTIEYGLGLFHYLNLGYGHGGDGLGFSIRCYTDPDKDFTIVLFTNCWNYMGGLENQEYFMEQQLKLIEFLYDTKQAVLDF
ncbi:MAG: beta-lactamase family protein [Bacteroidales bacterium]|nr:beta-lactamase family protein [Bacteroidales bacterium]